MAVVWELLARMREKQVKEGTTQPGFSHDLLLVRVPRVENYSNAASTNCFSTYSRLETAVRRARQRGELLLPGLKNRIYDDDHTRGERKAGAGCRDLTSCRGGRGCGPGTAAAISAWHLQSKPSREGAISPPSWDSRRSSGRPAASGRLAVPQEASAQYAAY